MSIRKAIATTTVLALLVAACGGDDSAETTTEAPTSTEGPIDLDPYVVEAEGMECAYLVL